jgi:hypothetical protein
MKKYMGCMLIGLLSAVTVIQAQNVGIGTVTPTGRLHIELVGTANEDALVINDDANPVMWFRRNNTDRGFLQLNFNDIRIGTAVSNDSGRMILRTNGGDRLIVSPTGNVGIAVADPQARLHIISATDVSLTSNGYIMLGNPASQNMVFDNNEIQSRNDSATADLFLQAEGGKTQLGATADSNIEIEGTSIQALFNGSSETLILQAASGGKTRLGNGFDFANTKFHISTGNDAGLATNQSGYMMIGMSASENIVFDNNEILARNNGVASTLFLAREGSTVQLGNGTPATGTKLHISTGSDVGLTDALSGYMMIGSQAGSNIIADNNEIQARNNGASSTLYLQNGGGNVYIGDQANFTGSHRLGVDGNAVITGALRIGSTVTPSGYKLAVDGRVICTEVLVRLVANWPDYVFNNQHQLRNLDELESFIEKNKHLPGIPSAAEIEKSGVSLGEMQRLQMEKIEELTLYILQLKKEITQMKQQR